MKVHQTLFDHSVPLLIQFFEAQKRKHRNIYIHGRLSEFCYADDEFRSRYNQVKDKHEGSADAEMMELYDENSPCRVFAAMMWCLKEGEYLVFAMLFHRLRPMFVSCFAKQCIASYPESFEAFHYIHKLNLTIMQLFYGLILYLYSKYRCDKTADKMSSDEILKLEKTVKEVGLSGLFFDASKHEVFVKVHFDVDTCNFIHLDKYFALDRSQSNDFLDVTEDGDQIVEVEGDKEEEEMEDDSDSEYSDHQEDDEMIQDYSQQVAIFVSHDYGSGTFYA